MMSLWSTETLSVIPLQLSVAVAILVIALCAVQALATARPRSCLTVWCVAAICWLLAAPALMDGLDSAAASAFLTLAPALAAVSTWWAIRQMIAIPVKSTSNSSITGSAVGVMACGTLITAFAIGWFDLEAGASTSAAAAAAVLTLEARRLKDRALRRWLALSVLLLVAGSMAIILGQSPCCSELAPFVTPVWVLSMTLVFLGYYQTNEQTRLLKQAALDGLTGLSRREALFSYFQSLGLRADQRIAVIMIDADHFKQINDRHGHAAGDTVLARLGQVISSNVRDADLAARYGGEEFCVVLTADEALTVGGVAERLVRQVGGTRIDLDGTTAVQVSISAGYAIGTAGDLAGCFRAADTALYAAKQAGRDRALGAAAS